MHQKVRTSSVILRVFALILGCFFAAVTAVAQEKAANVAPATQPQAISTAVTPATGNSSISASDLVTPKATSGTPAINAPGVGARVPSQTAAPSAATKSDDKTAPGTSNVVNDYKKSLAALQALYEREVQKLDQQNIQIKGLYKDGLVSRVDVEKSDKELADARAKVEDARNQIAEANKPVVVAAVSTNPVPSNAVWSTGNNRVDTLVRFYGNKYSVDPYLIFCLMHQESRFSNNATSPKGAQGLMQLMPGTAARYGITNPYDVGQSIMGGTRYLKDLLQMFNGRIDLALAGYNAGENAVIKHGYTVPPYQETRDYVRLITKRYSMKPAS
jgi:soluble lytic murein transglycosylase-like protein